MGKVILNSYVWEMREIKRGRLVGKEKMFIYKESV